MRCSSSPKLAVHVFKAAKQNYFTSNIPTLSWWRYSGVGHSSNTLRVGRHSRETLGLGTLGLGTLALGLALQGDSGVGHSRETLGWETLGLGTPGTLWGWAP